MISKKNRYRYALSVAATLILFSNAASNSAASRPVYAGITSAIDSISSSIDDMKKFIDDTKKTITGISLFFQKIGSFIDLIGLPTLLLFISVIFLSSGFASIGVPRGIPSFFFSLFTADAVWILWETSFGSGLADILPYLLKSNFIIFTPLLAIWIFRLLWPKGASIIKKLLLYNKRPALSKNMIIELTGRIQNDWAEFQKNLTKDIIASSGSSDVSISPETYVKIKSIKENLDNLSIKEKK